MMNRAFLLLFAGLIALGGCARPADLAKPKQFHDGGIIFDYPGNWKISKNEKLPALRLIFLEEPGDALVILTVYDSGFEVDLAEYSTAFVENLGTAVPFDLLKNKSTTTKGGQIDCKYAIHLGGIDVPHTANITKHVFDGRQVICVTQVSDEDRHFVDPGFDLVRRTLAANPSKK